MRRDEQRRRDTHMRSREFAQKRRRRSDAPLRYHQKRSLHTRGEGNLLDGSELDEYGAGMRRWTEIPDVFLVHGGVGTTLDERVDPTEGDPLDDGNIVFWGILDRLGAYMKVRDA